MPSIQIMKKHLIEFNKQVKKDFLIGGIHKMKKEQIITLFNKYFSSFTDNKTQKESFIPDETIADMSEEKSWDYEKFKSIPSKIVAKPKLKKPIVAKPIVEKPTPKSTPKSIPKSTPKSTSTPAKPIVEKSTPAKPIVKKLTSKPAKKKYIVIDPKTLTSSKQINLYKLIMDNEDFLKRMGVSEYNQIIAGVLSPTNLKNITLQNRSWDRKYMNLAKLITTTLHKSSFKK